MEKKGSFSFPNPGFKSPSGLGRPRRASLPVFYSLWSTCKQALLARVAASLHFSDLVKLSEYTLVSSSSSSLFFPTAARAHDLHALLLTHRNSAIDVNSAAVQSPLRATFPASWASCPNILPVFESVCVLHFCSLWGEKKLQESVCNQMSAADVQQKQTELIEMMHYWRRLMSSENEMRALTLWLPNPPPKTNPDAPQRFLIRRSAWWTFQQKLMRWTARSRERSLNTSQVIIVRFLDQKRQNQRQPQTLRGKAV